jgi:hypothetical protein
MSTFPADAGFPSVCYHAAGSNFNIGVTEETALNAAIQPKPGWKAGVEKMATPGASSQITVSNSKNA